MEVILLEKVTNPGSLGDKVNTKGNYTHNFLLPWGEAAVVTAENAAAFEARRAELEEAVAERKAATEAHATQLSGLVVTPGAHAGDESKLFSPIGTRGIAEAVSTAGYPPEKAEVRLPNGAPRSIGEFNVTMHLHTNVETTLESVTIAE